MCSEHIEGDEWGTYVALVRAAPPERGMPYRARAPRARSHRSSRGWGEPIARRRVAGRRQMNGGRVRDAHEPEPKCLASTGELIDIERVTISSEGDRWKSTRKGNSLAVYPTARPVRRGAGGKGQKDLARMPTLLRSHFQARLSASVRLLQNTRGGQTALSWNSGHSASRMSQT